MKDQEYIVLTMAVTIMVTNVLGAAFTILRLYSHGKEKGGGDARSSSSNKSTGIELPAFAFLSAFMEAILAKNVMKIVRAISFNFRRDI